MARSRRGWCRSPRWAFRCSAGILPPPPRPPEPRAVWHRAAVALQSFAGWRMVVDLFLLAACGGIFSVPLYAIIQDARRAVRAVPHGRRQQHHERAVHGGRRRRGRGSGRQPGCSAPAVLHVAALANLLVAVWIVRILPHEVYRALLRWYFNTFHGVRVSGLENYHAAGDRVVIVANHQSYLDALPDRRLPAGQPQLRNSTRRRRRNGGSSRSSPRSIRSR